MRLQIITDIHLGDEVRYVLFYTVSLIYQLPTSR